MTHCRPAARARRRTRRSEVTYPSSCKSHKIRSMPARFLCLSWCKYLIRAASSASF